MQDSYPWLHHIIKKGQTKRVEKNYDPNSRQEKIRLKILRYIENNQLPLVGKSINNVAHHDHEINGSLHMDNLLGNVSM